MAVFTILATGVSAVAVYYVVRTYRETVLSNERQLRAYINVSTEAAYGDDKGAFLITIKFTNRGQTPAYDTKIKSEWNSEGFETADNISFGETPSRGTIGPNESGTRVFTTKDNQAPGAHLTPHECRQIRSGELPLWVYGSVHYTDAFGKDRFTNFRYKFRGGGDTAGLMVCEEGNESN